MIEFWLSLRLEPQKQLALVLDASDSAAEVKGTILGIARQLLQSVGDSARTSLFFLGSHDSWSLGKNALGEIERCWPGQHRPSLISPVFEQLREDAGTLAVIIGSGRIFDLEDWTAEQGGPVERAVFIAPERSLTGGLHPEARAFSLGLLPSGWDEAVTSVSIGSLAMPFSWDNAAYEWKEGKLVAERPSQPEVRIGFLHPQRADACATLKLRGGHSRLVELQPAAVGTEIEWGKMPTLPLEDAMRFQQCIERGNYLCPRCGHIHEARQVLVSCGMARPDPIYNALNGRNGLILMQDRGSLVRFASQACPALRMGQDAVALREKGGFSIYRCEGGKSGWQRTPQQLEQHQRVGENVYAIIL